MFYLLKIRIITHLYVFAGALISFYPSILGNMPGLIDRKETFSIDQCKTGRFNGDQDNPQLPLTSKRFAQLFLKLRCRKYPVYKVRN
jgi:hypothetical protein